jgi:hypothetical protein
MEESKYRSYSFSISALDGVSGQRHARAALYPRERTPGIHWIGDWVGPRDGLDTEGRWRILCICRASNLGRPVCSQPLYWLSYPTPVPLRMKCIRCTRSVEVIKSYTQVVIHFDAHITLRLWLHSALPWKAFYIKRFLLENPSNSCSIRRR